MKALIAGTGSIGRRHISNIQALEPETEFFLYRAEAREDDFSKDLGAKVFDDIEVALAAADYLVIANPSSLHAKLLAPAMKSNKPIYVEKPVVTDDEQLQQVRGVVTSYSASSLVGCNLRFLPAVQRLKEMLPKIGQVKKAHISCGQYLPDWRPSQDYRKSYSASKELGGGVVFDLIHEIDMSRFLLGEAESVSAKYGNKSDLEIETEDFADIRISTSKCTDIEVQLDYISKPAFRKYELVGESGTLLCDVINKSLKLGDEVITNNLDDFDVKTTYIAAMEEFLKAVKSGGQTSQSLEEGLKTAELAIKIKAEGECQ